MSDVLIVGGSSTVQQLIREAEFCFEPGLAARCPHLLHSFVRAKLSERVEDSSECHRLWRAFEQWFRVCVDGEASRAELARFKAEKRDWTAWRDGGRVERLLS